MKIVHLFSSNALFYLIFWPIFLPFFSFEEYFSLFLPVRVFFKSFTILVATKSSTQLCCVVETFSSVIQNLKFRILELIVDETRVAVLVGTKLSLEGEEALSEL